MKEGTGCNTAKVTTSEKMIQMNTAVQQTSSGTQAQVRVACKDAANDGIGFNTTTNA